MGEMVSFETESGRISAAYLALPDTAPEKGDKRPAVIVIQEWWGLVPHIRDVTDRLAALGFVALAPDLYGGKTTSEPDEASKLMMELTIDAATEDMAAAFDYLASHERVQANSVGCMGFCMGGALVFHLAEARPVSAIVTFYGLPYRSEPDYSKLSSPVLGHFAEHDEWVSWDRAQRTLEKLRTAGVDARFHLYEGTRHGFFNDSRPGVYSPTAAQLAWDRTLEFFRTHLGSGPS